MLDRSPTGRTFLHNATVQTAPKHRANRLLAALEPEDFLYLEPHLEIVGLQQGQVLSETGDTLDHAYFPHDTIISLLAVMEDGSSAEMSVYGRDAVTGMVAALATRKAFGRYMVEFTGTASRVGIEKLYEVLNAHPNLWRVMRHFTEAIMSRTLHAVACNAIHSVEARCCRWILSTRHWIDQDTFPLTHELLAERLGVQRSTVSTVMGKLQTAGLIRQGRGEITITDSSGLEETACECYGRIRDGFERLLSYAAVED